MKAKTVILSTILLAALVLAACAPLPPGAPTPSAPQPAPAPGSPALPLPNSPAPLQPPAAEVCNGMAQALRQALTVEVTQAEAPVSMTDPVSMASGTGCRALATGTGEQFSSPGAAVKALTTVLVGGGWAEDPQLAADGPTGTGTGFRSRDLVCLAGAHWAPDASAHCPADQPISACQVTPAQQLYTVTLDCAQSGTPAAGGPVGLPNPASQNCIAQGGQLKIEARRDGGQFGVCYFEDNRQCEEWALMRGECPVGGVKVTGYVTPAARYCAITGGKYTITGRSGQADEQGACTLVNGAQCDAWAYYDGTCGGTTAAISATQVITYTPELPTGAARQGSCWTSSLAVWRANAWRCSVGNEIYDPCFTVGDSVVCGADPLTPGAAFALKLTEPLPAADVPADTSGHAWQIELPDGTKCGFATGATGVVGDERINYLCNRTDPNGEVVVLGDLQPGVVWMAHRAVISGDMSNPKVHESALAPLRTVWR